MRSNSTLALLLLAAACAGSESSNDKSSASTGLNEATQAQALCVQSFQRQRECTDTFLPALVDARVRFNKPDGIADMDKKEGREALVAQAREEWKTDSTDEVIADTCTGMVEHGALNGEMGAAVSQCLAAADCGAFVPCQIKIIEQHLSR